MNSKKKVVCVDLECLSHRCYSFCTRIVPAQGWSWQPFDSQPRTSARHVKSRRQIKSQLPSNSSSSFPHILGSECSASDHSFQEDKEGNFQQRQTLIVLCFDSVEYLNL